MSQIPKKIWGLWLDFNNNKDGILNDDLIYFTNRIKNLHKESWEINIITEWSKLLELIGENTIIIEILNNKFIGGAHKADLLRFFLLNEHGGIWIDISTFLVESFDNLISNPEISFITYYASTVDVAEWLINPLGELYEDIPYNNRIEKWVNRGNDFIKIKNKYNQFNFIPENYFLCSTKNHPITQKTFEQLIDFWNPILNSIKSKEDLCFFQNKYILSLTDTIFKIKYNNFLSNVDKLIINKFKANKKLKRYYLNKLFDCGYLFNYLQLYLSIVEYIKENENFNITYNNVPTLALESKFQNFFNYICATNLCSEININLIRGDKKETVLLLPASYNRFGKWSDNRDERLSWENTYLGSLLSSIKNKTDADNLLEKFKNERFTQFKFGAFTRDSPIIKIIKTWYPEFSGGKKILKTNIKRKTKIILKNRHKITKRKINNNYL